MKLIKYMASAKDSPHSKGSHSTGRRCGSQMAVGLLTAQLAINKLCELNLVPVVLCLIS